MINPTTRFSNTVKNYIRFRPGYPPEFLIFMKNELALDPNSIIADIGSGTGKLSRLFLENGNSLYGIEPNTEMRSAAEDLFDNYLNFHSLEGTAEAISLESHSIDFITAAQAFHWFDVDKTKKEFKRILKPNGYVLLIWNKRLDNKSAFMKDYNAFLENYSTDLQSINLRRVANETGMNQFFGEGKFQMKRFEHFQQFDFSGVKGRYLSCSYAYQKEHPDYEKAMKQLNIIFDQHEQNGKLKMWYEMVVYFGRL